MQVTTNGPGDSPERFGQVFIEAPPLSHFPQLIIITCQQNRGNSRHKGAGKETAQDAYRLPGSSEHTRQELLPGLISDTGCLLLYKLHHHPAVYMKHTPKPFTALCQKLPHPSRVAEIHAQPPDLNMQISTRQRSG